MTKSAVRMFCLALVLGSASAFAVPQAPTEISTLAFLEALSEAAPATCMFEAVGWDGSDMGKVDSYTIKLADATGKSDTVTIPSNAAIKKALGSTPKVGAPSVPTVTYYATFDGKRIVALKNLQSPTFSYLELGAVNCTNKAM